MALSFLKPDMVDDRAAEIRSALDGLETTKPGQPIPLSWVDMSKWDDEPPSKRRWSILNRAPANQAGLFSGEGGTGKSIVELMKNVAHVTGKDWLGSMPEMGPAIYIGAEDDVDEVHRRLADITAHYGVTFKQLIEGGLRVMCLLGKDATLCACTSKSGKVETTGLYKQLYEVAGDIKPKNISIDTLSRAFVGSEIERTQVYGFATHMQALAMVTEGGSVTILSHPSLAGMATGSGISGSTAWHGAFRFRQYLKSSKAETEEPDDDLRELEFKKNQYGPKGETIVLRYQNGLFLPVAGQTTLERAAHEAKADDLFLRLLRRFTEQGRNVSDKPKANAYAPREFAAEPEAKEQRLRLAEMEDAMRRLFTAGRIRMDDYGRPSRPSFRMVCGEGVQHTVQHAYSTVTHEPSAGVAQHDPYIGDHAARTHSSPCSIPTTPSGPEAKKPHFRVLGPAPGETCLKCYQADERVMRVSGGPGQKSEPFHPECAEKWFKDLGNVAVTRDQAAYAVAELAKRGNVAIHLNSGVTLRGKVAYDDVIHQIVVDGGRAYARLEQIAAVEIMEEVA